MKKYFDFIISSSGRKVTTGSVSVLIYGTATPASLFSDAAGTVPIANPVPIDSRGYFEFYAADGRYSLTVNTPDFNPVTLTDIVLDDPASGADIGYTPAGAGAVATTVQAKLRESVSVKDFGAVCDGTTDDTAAIQAAIDYCATFTRWPALIIPGRCKVTASINIDRPVDSRQDYFRIIGQGAGAGFYTTSAVTVFTSTLAYGAANAWGALAPCSEFVSFECLQFETSSSTELSYALSGKFLRVKFLNCWFERMKCANASTAYLQTWYFLDCSIRYVGAVPFLTGLGSFDVSFLHNVIENNYRLFYSAPAAPGGNSGFRLIENVIEGTSVVSGVGTLGMTGVANGVIAHNHIEQNVTADFNFSVGTSVASYNLLIEGNYIVCDSGKVAFYHWTNTNVTSINNTICSTGGTAGQLHNQVARVTNFISVNDTLLNSATLSDATIYSVVNGVYRAGAAQDTWTHTSNHITKNSIGEFGFGSVPIGTVRGYFKGASATSSDFSAIFANSNGVAALAIRDDLYLLAAYLGNYANDTAAAGGGVPVGAMYRNGSVVQVRVV
jgi:Pectate lyase superfamily protein